MYQEKINSRWTKIHRLFNTCIIYCALLLWGRPTAGCQCFIRRRNRGRIISSDRMNTHIDQSPRASSIIFVPSLRASFSCSPSQTSSMVLPHLMQAAIIWRVLFALKQLPLKLILTSHGYFSITPEKYEAGLRWKPRIYGIVRFFETMFLLFSLFNLQTKDSISCVCPVKISIILEYILTNYVLFDKIITHRLTKSSV